METREWVLQGNNFLNLHGLEAALIYIISTRSIDGLDISEKMVTFPCSKRAEGQGNKET